jgi:flagellar motor switch protein FliM
VIEPIMGVLAAQNWFSYQRKGGQEDHLRKLTKNVQGAPVQARVFLAQTTITMNDLLSLSVGDVITTNKDCRSDVLLQVEGQAKFMGKIGQFRGNRAIRVTRKIHPPAETPPAEKSK